MYRAYSFSLPDNIQKCFSLDVTYQTRCEKRFKNSFVRTNLKAMCLSIKGIKLWNSLDNNLKSCSNINTFKKELKLTYIEKYRSDELR